MTEQKPNMPPEEREPSPEELAVIKAGKEDVEQRKMAIGQPIPLMTDVMWLLTDEGREVFARALGRDSFNRPLQVRSETVTVLVPREFTWNATHHHRFLLRQGVRDVPASLLDVKWIRDNGVQVWQRPETPQAQPIMGSMTLGPTVTVGTVQKPSGPFLAQAFSESGLSVDDWNSLSDEERGTRAIDCATKAGAAQAVSDGTAVPGAGAGTVQRQSQDRMQQEKPPQAKIAPGPPRK